MKDLFPKFNQYPVAVFAQQHGVLLPLVAKDASAVVGHAVALVAHIVVDFFHGELPIFVGVGQLFVLDGFEKKVGKHAVLLLGIPVGEFGFFAGGQHHSGF